MAEFDAFAYSGLDGFRASPLDARGISEVSSLDVDGAGTVVTSLGTNSRSGLKLASFVAEFFGARPSSLTFADFYTTLGTLTTYQKVVSYINSLNQNFIDNGITVAYGSILCGNTNELQKPDGTLPDYFFEQRSTNPASNSKDFSPSIPELQALFDDVNAVVNLDATGNSVYVYGLANGVDTISTTGADTYKALTGFTTSAASGDTTTSDIVPSATGGACLTEDKDSFLGEAPLTLGGAVSGFTLYVRGPYATSLTNHWADNHMKYGLNIGLSALGIQQGSIPYSAWTAPNVVSAVQEGSSGIRVKIGEAEPILNTAITTQFFERCRYYIYAEQTVGELADASPRYTTVRSIHGVDQGYLLTGLSTGTWQVQVAQFSPGVYLQERVAPSQVTFQPGVRSTPIAVTIS